jgi:glycerol-3-phosphate acyltransferase PlsY
MDVALQVLIGAVVGYLLGIIPSGGMVARAHGIDLTRIGSGSTGATNVLRTLGTRWAVVVAVMDWLKGSLAVLVTGLIIGGAPWDVGNWGQVAAAIFAVVGHSFSPFLGFRGGKGILTGGGGLIVLAPVALVIALVLGAIAIATSKYVSLGSLVATVVASVIVLWQGLSGNGPTAFILYATLLPAFILMTHRGNIYRLATGTERRLSKTRIRE